MHPILCVVVVPYQGDGDTALIHSIKENHIDVALVLIAFPGINVNHATVSVRILTPSPRSSWGVG